MAVASCGFIPPPFGLAPPRQLQHSRQRRTSCVSPGGSPFSSSLPPSQLNAPPGSEYPDNYHAYSVLKTMVVQSGPIAPWFAQPGFGIQFLIPASVITLVDQGYLARVNLTRGPGTKKIALHKTPDAPVPDINPSASMVSVWAVCGIRLIVGWSVEQKGVVYRCPSNQRNCLAVH
jgi:hypothetical protein